MLGCHNEPGVSNHPQRGTVKTQKHFLVMNMNGVSRVIRCTLRSARRELLCLQLDAAFQSGALSPTRAKMRPQDSLSRLQEPVSYAARWGLG